MSFGYTRKELGKLHKEFYEERMAKNSDKEAAFQRALMSMVKAMMDVIDANNQRLEEDVKAYVKKKIEQNEKEK